jgi:hypothetical protein
MYNVDANAFAPDSNESAFIQSLQARANGQAPSAAELQMRAGLDQATQQAQAMAASARGVSPALAQRYAMQNQAQMAQANNQQTGILRAQEQAQATGDLGNELRSVRTGRENLQSLNSQNYNQNNQINAQSYNSAAKQRSGLAGGLFNSMGAGAVAGMFAEGGEVGDEFQLPDNPAAQAAPSGGDSNSYAPAKGGGGGMGALLALLKDGGLIPGKAPVKGNSFQNDIVDAKLSPGEVVLPRSVTMAENAPEKAKEFVEHIKSLKNKKKSADGPNYADVLKAHQELGKHLKKLAYGGAC